MSAAVVWLRNDLRSQWHSPLDYAIANHEQVIAVYCLTPKQWRHYHYAACKINLILDRLDVVRDELATRQVNLILIDCDDFSALPDALLAFCQSHKAEALYFNAEYEWDERVRDKRVKALCSENSIKVACFHDTCVVRPDLVMSKQQSPYKMFTPYFNTWLSILLQALPTPQTKANKAKRTAKEVPFDLTSYRVKTEINPWPVGESDISQALQQFILEKAPDYAENRDYPAIDGTSQISHLLSIGALSARQCVAQLVQAHHHQATEPGNGVYVWLKEIAWRDFYRYVMFHFPHVAKNKPFQQHYHYLKWSTNEAHFLAWQDGKTGYPIVDAAMRALKATGWMHNRLRMIVASFYCKHLFLPWRWAEDYFMSQLVDGDFASNNGGWQWSASVGTDAAPYFRIFNPTNQSQKYDANGEFIKRWVPELKNLSSKHIHQPHLHADVLKLGYYLPIVDHAESVARTKREFKQFIEMSQQSS